MLHLPVQLDLLKIPPPNANWKLNDSLLPKVFQEKIVKYFSQRKGGSQSQPRKDTQDTSKWIWFWDLCQGKDKKPYGHDARPEIILFYSELPRKGHCNCPIGTSGLLCHVFALLLYLKHFWCRRENVRIDMHSAILKMTQKNDQGLNLNDTIKLQKSKICKQKSCCRPR